MWSLTFPESFPPLPSIKLIRSTKLEKLNAKNNFPYTHICNHNPEVEIIIEARNALWGSAEYILLLNFMKAFGRKLMEVLNNSPIYFNFESEQRGKVTWAPNWIGNKEDKTRLDVGVEIKLCFHVNLDNSNMICSITLNMNEKAVRTFQAFIRCVAGRTLY